MLSIVIIVMSFLSPTSAYMNVHYEFYQDSGIVSDDLKLFCCNAYIDFEYRAVMVNETNLNHTGLGFTWLQTGVCEPGVMYMMKSYAKEVLDSPYELYKSENGSTVFHRPLLCLFDTGTELSIRVKLTGTWDKFMLAINIDKGVRALRMSLNQNLNQAKFQTTINNTAQNHEYVHDLTPFSTEEEIMITLVVKETCIQVQVNNEDYYCYPRTVYMIDGHIFVAWRGSLADGMAYIYSFAMRCPTLTI